MPETKHPLKVFLCHAHSDGIFVLFLFYPTYFLFGMLSHLNTHVVDVLATGMLRSS